MAKTASLELTDKIMRSDSAISANSGGEIVLMSLDTNSYYGLNQLGSRIWELLDHATTGQDIAASIVQEYEVDDATARRDVLALLRDLLSERLIVTYSA